MKEGHPAEYVAAAIAYALFHRKLPVSSDVRRDVIELLRAEYYVEIPSDIIVPARKILSDEGLLSLDADKYRPLVTVPNDFSSRMAVWRFSDHRTPTGTIVHRFMAGPYDWMQSVLRSEDFINDIRDHYSLNRLVEPKAEIEGARSTSIDDRTSEELGTQPEHGPSHAPISISIRNTNSQPLLRSSDKDRSAVRAVWFGGWGTWIAALIAAVGIFVTLRIAGKI